MPDDRSHPLLQQTPLSVNPFIDLPKPPTLPPTYTSLPSTLPPSILNTPASSNTNNADLPAYVSSTTGGFSAHPSTIIAQNQALLAQIQRQSDEGRDKVEQWEKGIQERELQERRRRAPGWLDREERILQPEKVGLREEMKQVKSLIDGDGGEEGDEREDGGAGGKGEVDDLGEAMDRAFGRSEMDG